MTHTNIETKQRNGTSWARVPDITRMNLFSVKKSESVLRTLTTVPHSRFTHTHTDTEYIFQRQFSFAFYCRHSLLLSLLAFNPIQNAVQSALALYNWHSFMFSRRRHLVIVTHIFFGNAHPQRRRHIKASSAHATMISNGRHSREPLHCDRSAHARKNRHSLSSCTTC